MIEPLRGRSRFAALRRDGIRVRRGAMSVVHLPALPEEPPVTAVGYALTRRVGSAVVRNRLRRRLRAVVQEVSATRPGGLPAGSLLFSAGPEVTLHSPDELRNDVVRLLDAVDSRNPR